jgi:hypothetical protein
MSSNIKYPRSGQHIGCICFQSPLNYVYKPTELWSCLLLYMEVKLVFHIKRTTQFEGIREEVQTKKRSEPMKLEEEEGSCIMRTAMICTAQKVLRRWSYQRGWKRRRRVARLGKKRPACRDLMDKPEGKRQLGKYGAWKWALLHMVKRYSSSVAGLEWPRGFQEVKVPRFHDNGTGWW